MAKRRKVLLILVAALACDLAAATVSAQAWLPPKGEAWFSLAYGNLYVHDPFSAGEGCSKATSGRTACSPTWAGITDRLGVVERLVAPPAAECASGAHRRWDDHGTFTDFHLEARYNAVKAPVVLTPFVGVILPSHQYEYFGHAINGFDLKQLLIGTAFGFHFGPGPSDPSSKDIVSILRRLLPNAYIQGRYSYAFVERVMDISHNRSNLDLQIAYFVTPSLQVMVFGMGQWTYGGLVLDKASIATWTAADFHHHAQASRSELLEIGGGVDYQLTNWIDLSATYMTTPAGKNDHAINSLFNIGVTLGFSPRQVIRRMSSSSRSAPMMAPGL
jgi:hypothetical protein